MTCLSFESFVTNNSADVHFIHSIRNMEMITNKDCQNLYILNCHQTLLDDSQNHQSIIIEDCSNCTFQLGVAEHTVIVRNCKQITLSVCCNRLCIM